MEVKKNKMVVAAYFDAVDRGDLAAAFLLLSDEAVCTIPASLPLQNVQTKMHFMEVHRSFQRAFPSGLHWKVISMVAEGDQVAVEVEARGVHTSGREYHDTHCAAVTLNQGVIHQLHEYFDTLGLLRCWSTTSKVTDCLSWSEC